MTLGVLGLILAVSYADGVRTFLESHFVRDGQIKNLDRFYIALYSGPLYLLVFGFVLFQLDRLRFFAGAHYPGLAHVEQLRPSLISTLAFFGLGLLLILQYVVGCHMKTPFSHALCAPYQKEGFYELLTFLVFMGGALWLVDAALICRRLHSKGIEGFSKLQVLLLLLVASASFVIAMEEVSWGQTYLQWETPEFVAEVNVQKETNFHNLFNDYFPIANFLAGIVVFLGTFWFVWMTATSRWDLTWQVLSPNPNLIGLAACFPLAAPVDGEALEILAAVYLLACCWGLRRVLHGAHNKYVTKKLGLSDSRELEATKARPGSHQGPGKNYHFYPDT